MAEMKYVEPHIKYEQLTKSQLIGMLKNLHKREADALNTVMALKHEIVSLNKRLDGMSVLVDRSHESLRGAQGTTAVLRQIILDAMTYRRPTDDDN